MAYRKERYPEYNFEKTVLYHSISTIIGGWRGKCWYLRMISFPIMSFTLLMAVVISILIDMFYFGFKLD
jgi:hypothetical protein